MKYIVFESKICELVRQVCCRECNSILVIDDEPELGFCKGSMLSIKLNCLNGHPWSCQSQPLLGSGTEAVPAGNLIISSAIFFSGDNFSKPDHFANFINLKFNSRSCMTKHQKDFLFPAVHEACTTSSIHC